MAKKVKRESVEACITCPLCNNLLRHATTISLCLHTFCRKCIYDKLSDDDTDSCPVCNIDLGCLPLEKLRPDHNLQDIRAKIFPYKRRKVKAPEVAPSMSLPAKRKERSLSSLVVNAPKVSTRTSFTGKRTKTGKRIAAALHSRSFLLEDSIKKEETSSRDSQNSSIPEPSKKHKFSEDKENNMELAEVKADLWTPLNCLVEAANRTKSSSSNSQGTSRAKLESLVTSHGGLEISEITTKSEPPTLVQSELNVPKIKTKTKTKDNGHNKFGDEKGGNTFPSGPVKRRRKHPFDKIGAEASEVSVSARAKLDATGRRCNRKNSPIWFSLVASEDQKGDVPLPQIPACYLRITDGTVPVSFIHKYLVKKLDLASEAEVEIMCKGESVLPSLKLHNLVDLWFRTASTSKKIPASVGSSAKDFVMVLSYCRKAVPH